MFGGGEPADLRGRPARSQIRWRSRRGVGANFAIDRTVQPVRQKYETGIDVAGPMVRVRVDRNERRRPSRLACAEALFARLNFIVPRNTVCPPARADRFPSRDSDRPHFPSSTAPVRVLQVPQVTRQSPFHVRNLGQYSGAAQLTLFYRLLPYLCRICAKAVNQIDARRLLRIDSGNAITTGTELYIINRLKSVA